MARGLVLLSSRFRGADEIIKDGKNGYLFDIGDTDKAVSLINNLNNNVRKMKEIRENNFRDIKRYTPEIQAKKYANVYMSL